MAMIKIDYTGDEVTRIMLKHIAETYKIPVKDRRNVFGTIEKPPTIKMQWNTDVPADLVTPGVTIFIGNDQEPHVEPIFSADED